VTIQHGHFITRLEQDSPADGARGPHRAIGGDRGGPWQGEEVESSATAASRPVWARSGFAHVGVDLGQVRRQARVSTSTGPCQSPRMLTSRSTDARQSPSDGGIVEVVAAGLWPDRRAPAMSEAGEDAATAGIEPALEYPLRGIRPTDSGCRAPASSARCRRLRCRWRNGSIAAPTHCRQDYPCAHDSLAPPALHGLHRALLSLIRAGKDDDARTSRAWAAWAKRFPGQWAVEPA